MNPETAIATGGVDPLSAAHGVQGLLEKGLGTGVAALLVILVAYLLLENRGLRKEVQQLARECVAHIERSTAAHAALVARLEELKPRRRDSQVKKALPEVAP